MHTVHKEKLAIASITILIISSLCGFIYTRTYYQQVSVLEFTAHAQSTVIRCTQHFNDLIGQHGVEYSKILLTENCTDTELVLRLQNAKLSMTPHKFEITTRDFRMYGIESDTESIRATKKAIIAETLQSLKHITDAYNTFQSTVSGILIGSAPDVEKVKMLRYLLINTLSAIINARSSLPIDTNNEDFLRLKRFDA